MLVELRIRDYAVVEDLTLELGPGLNALTGETGAGKSIIVGALSLLLGERASSSVVRAGAERASVEAVFDVKAVSGLAERLEDHGFRTEDGLLILRREVAAEGRNRAWVNGSPATAGVVGELGSALVDLHGQHEHQTLLRSAEQRTILDAYAGAEGLAGRVAELHAGLRALRTRLAEREERRREIESRADFLRFQLGEIDAARLSPGVEDELDAEASRLEHAQELAEGTAAAHEVLYASDDSVADRIAEVRATLKALARYDPGLAEGLQQLEDAFHAVNDVGRRMADYAASVEHDPARLDQLRAHLDQIFRLKRKYGPELDDVLATAERVRAELSELDEGELDLERMTQEIAEAAAAVDIAAGALSDARTDAAQRLARAVESALPELGLPGARFEVRLTPLPEVGPAGAETVDFLVSTNPGFEVMSLARIASGGELSRVMLALKSILADVDRVPVLVFDEIDAGIGGVVGTAVGRKLSDVARRHQVLVVTHLAQLASMARVHLRVTKSSDVAVTSASVSVLEGDARVEEVARMLGGDPDSETSRQHARELLAAG